MYYRHTDSMVKMLTEFFAENSFLAFAYVPTSNVQPSFRLVDGDLYMGLVDLSPNNVCDEQLKRILHGYRELLTEAQGELKNPSAAVKRLRIEQKSLWAMIESWQLTHAEELSDFDWLEGDDDDSDEDEVPSWLKEFDDNIFADGPFSQAERKVVVLPTPDKLDFFEHICRWLSVKPSGWSVDDQSVFVGDVSRYIDLSNQLQLMEQKVVWLKLIISALERETKNRENSAELSRLRLQLGQNIKENRKVIQDLNTKLYEQRIRLAVQALQCFDPLPSDEVITQKFGSDAPAIIEALHTPKPVEPDLSWMLTDIPVEPEAATPEPATRETLDEHIVASDVIHEHVAASESTEA